MKRYQTVSKKFSRLWRRSKTYTYPELRWLARRQGLTLQKHKGSIQISGPKGVEAEFAEMAEPQVLPRHPDKVALAVLSLPFQLPQPKI